MNCCKTCYSVCDPVISCFETLLVYIPVGYAESTIKLRFSNGQNHVVYFTGDVIAGTHVEIDPNDTIFPEGYFSTYGGPYEIRFIGTDLNEITFVAIDGKSYNCISFQVVNGNSDETTAFVNAFYNELPGGY